MKLFTPVLGLLEIVSVLQFSHSRIWSIDHWVISRSNDGRLLLFSEPCKQALGMQNRHIPNSAITASSMHDTNHAPYLGRLHFAARGSLQGAWSARFNDRYQYLQVDFRKPAKVTSVLTQGRQNANQWVTQFRLSSSQDGLSWADYKVLDSIKVRGCFL